jgi:hypothetical protein
MNNKKFSEYSNEEKVFFYISKFGWLRIYDLAKIVWPKSDDENNAYRYASKIIEKLKAEGWVKSTLLKKRRGTAVNLTKSGGLQARKMGFHPTIARDDWKEPDTAEHDLLTIMVYTHLVKNQGFCYYRFLSDAEVKKARVESTNEVLDYNGNVKIPDLICYDRFDKTLISIETECKSKTGNKNKDPLIESIIKTNTFRAPYKFEGRNNKVYQPKMVVLAYNPEQRAKNGKRVNNLTNVIKGLLEKLREYNLSKVNLQLIEVTVTQTMRAEKVYVSRTITLYVDDTKSDFLKRVEYDKQGLNQNGEYDPEMF